MNKGLHRIKHDTTPACRQGQVVRVYFNTTGVTSGTPEFTPGF